MRIILPLGLLMALLMVGCQQPSEKSTVVATESQIEQTSFEPKMAGISSYEWMNEPSSYSVEGKILNVRAEKGTDFFNNPENSSVTGTAPMLFKEMTGDFVATAVVRPDFSAQWNAVSLMMYMDENYWIKFAFENSDATGKSIVTVVTREVSDDANGVVLNDKDMVWLRMIRKGNIYSMLWSEDGEDYKMARLAAMPIAESVKIGVEAQCPVGEGATHEILQFEIKEKTVADLRKGE